jgi:Na+-driven multidrug efflux pump
VINIGLNYLLIKQIGVAGAAWATLASYAVATYLGNLLFKKARVNFKLQTKALFTFYKVKVSDFQ